MKRYCPNCDTRYDDTFRLTICPHETFAANDGQNNFSHHPESFIVENSPVVCPNDGQKLQDHGSLLICPGCSYFIQSSDL
jgi:hypothetical protein